MNFVKAGIGYCNNEDAFLAGCRTAETAIADGSIDRPDIVLSFCAGCVDHTEFLRGLKSVVGTDVPVIGGSTIGIVTNEELSYEGYPTGTAIIQADKYTIDISYQGGLNICERDAGKILAENLNLAESNSTMFIFYDSIKKPATDTNPPVMNASAPLIAGIEEVAGEIGIFGAGLIGDQNFQPVSMFCGTKTADQCVVGAVINGDFNMQYSIMHGLTPLDGLYHTITEIEGDIIYKVDGNPIVEMIDDLYGNRLWRNQHPVQLVSIGVNHGKRYSIPQESHFVNRMITGALPDGSGVVLFEPDLEEGTEIQFMLKDTGEIIDSARKNSTEIMRDIHSKGNKPVLGFYIDCAGRTALLSNTQSEEAHEVQKVFNQYETPLFGIFSGVEIAPMAGKNRGLDLTGVLLVFTDGA